MIQTLTAPLPVRLANTGMIADRYRCVSGLGHGGSGTVYAAWDKVLGKVVALKILHGTAFQDSSARARFLREANIMSRLSHRNIVQILHMACLPDGRPFMAMDYVRGRSLSECIKEHGRLDCGTAATITAQIAKALSYAHQFGIVHRDVKPDNVVLEVLDGSLTAQLIDFGIARFENDMADPLTGANNLIGTPAYMSPEQCCGEPLDGRADIYSLGCMLFEMLTGQAPYNGTQLINIIWRQCNQKMPAIAPLERADKVPELLRTILEKSTAKNKEDRYQTAEEMLEDLRDLIAMNSSARLKCVESTSSDKALHKWSAAAAAIFATILLLCAAWHYCWRPDQLVYAPYIVAAQKRCSLPAACNEILRSRIVADLTVSERLRITREYFSRYCSAAGNADDQDLALSHLVCGLENIREATGNIEPIDAVWESADYLLEHKNRLAGSDKVANVLNHRSELIFATVNMQLLPENIHRVPDVRLKLNELAMAANLQSRAFARHDLYALRSSACFGEFLVRAHINDKDDTQFDMAYAVEAKIVDKIRNPHRLINLALAKTERLIHTKHFSEAKQKLKEIDSMDLIPSESEKVEVQRLHAILDPMPV